ncbi:hypothetical protein [Mixta intestinalis]|uniref:Uncharacterized protein n=1 Tax=Mixta intestinalis TaxID=1615494 RepID=A0A6P1Q0R4_9GAMM|nr:hypothetical protein [Mixta intestinalis]QHM71717.1 hypothetical protein C7M51_02008 [Mixta intestinalis]
MKYIVLPFLLLFSSLAGALSVPASSGTVFITGVIINGQENCDFSLELQTLHSSCNDDGDFETLSMPLVDFAKYKQRTFDKTDLNWLDSERSKVELVLSYR